MNLIVLFLLSRTLSTSLSEAESFIDLFEKSCTWDRGSPVSPIQERGYMKNCDPNSSYNISWEPKDIDPHRPLKFFIHYTLPADFERVEYSVHIKYRFIHVSKTRNITCKELFGNRENTVSCPIKKGFPVPPFTCDIWDVIRFKNFKGTFNAWITAENENHEKVLCGTFEANFL